MRADGIAGVRQRMTIGECAEVPSKLRAAARRVDEAVAEMDSLLVELGYER